MIPNGSKPPLLLEREMKNAEGVSEAAVGDRKPVVAGWAEQSRVKVERERSDRTLRRFCGANRWGWRAPEAAGVHQGESGERSEPDAGPRGGMGRVTPEPTVGGGGVGEAEPGQGGRERSDRTLTRSFAKRTGGGRRAALAARVERNHRAATKRRLSSRQKHGSRRFGGVRTTGNPN